MSKWNDASGQVLVMAAFSMTVLLGFAAFATDVGLMLRQRRMAQTAADAASIAAARESLNEGTPASVTSGVWTAAYHDTAMNGFTPGATNGTANSSTGVTLTLLLNPDIEISGFNSAGYVQAVVSLKTQTVFMNLFGFHSMNVSATAIASDAISSDGCIYVQNAGSLANPAVDMGGNSLIAASSCGMTVNGNLVMGGNGTIDALFVAVSGTYSG
ncbi:MAG: pilus assembly protein TadG-related protein, partial [Terracidiphilus sp.]